MKLGSFSSVFYTMLKNASQISCFLHLKNWFCVFFTRFICEKRPQNKFPRENFSVKNSYLCISEQLLLSDGKFILQKKRSKSFYFTFKNFKVIITFCITNSMHFTVILVLQIPEFFYIHYYIDLNWKTQFNFQSRKKEEPFLVWIVFF